VNKHDVRNAIKRAIETERIAQEAEKAIAAARLNAELASKEHKRAVVDLSNVLGAGSQGVLFDGQHVRVGQQGTLIVVPVVNAVDVSEPPAPILIDPPTVASPAVNKPTKAASKHKEAPQG